MPYAPFGIPYYHLPISKETKSEQEQQALALMDGKVDFVVLARYMQILSPKFLAASPQQGDQHPPFVPAGLHGWRAVRAGLSIAGVKIIGATAHDASQELDAGPIIDQDVARVHHRDSVADLKRHRALH